MRLTRGDRQTCEPGRTVGRSGAVAPLPVPSGPTALVGPAGLADAPAPATARTNGRSVWQRLNMEQVARRLIHTARLAAGEHAMARVSERLAGGTAPNGKPVGSGREVDGRSGGAHKGDGDGWSGGGHAADGAGSAGQANR